MDTIASDKKERINLRLKSNAKHLIERAAGLEGVTISHFILSSALERAGKTVRSHEKMILNAKNSKAFLDALDAPIHFNSRLSIALEEHDKRVVSK
ncbi:DUF1778 domain-containing protein [Desulfosarcina ovata]|uniref:DUF1778 domain-containing protein n=2 Tax=Desulfosarcina ovata TaxID=83564 RepID=A0A5K8A5A1_9BACT|nr:DUF1778 domain-containing protein [Desulfosarcina ovata]BBO80285.1 hypothetical protein DSCO28_08510 [Desulfosarcina ovata subsp. sediminis]BBO87675.1 hypothetical protein DSCOOX_08550 [Desulfosarcina ovata subsp. ovata]